jgi:hypothetical protein
MNKVLMILMLTVSFAFAANAQIPSQFVGTYKFGETGEQVTATMNNYFNHELKIDADGGATLVAGGYESARNLICLAKSVGSKVMVYFTLYNTEEGSNSSTTYESDELLLTLEYKTVKGKKVLWTTWGKYTPKVGAAKKGGGVYFEKQKAAVSEIDESDSTVMDDDDVLPSPNQAPKKR